MLDRILGNYDAIERDVEDDYSVFDKSEQCSTDVDIQLLDNIETVDADDE